MHILALLTWITEKSGIIIIRHDRICRDKDGTNIEKSATFYGRGFKKCRQDC